jgi:hypothetical protein
MHAAPQRMIERGPKQGRMNERAGQGLPALPMLVHEHARTSACACAGRVLERWTLGLPMHEQGRASLPMHERLLERLGMPVRPGAEQASLMAEPCGQVAGATDRAHASQGATALALFTTEPRGPDPWAGSD